jgi:hypothetical protein
LAGKHSLRIYGYKMDVENHFSQRIWAFVRISMLHQIAPLSIHFDDFCAYLAQMILAFALALSTQVRERFYQGAHGGRY